jgi:predicted RNA binding protein YcfA (HicA-like mRNA interferase family)
MTSQDIIKKLKKDGWELVNIVGSHHKFKHPTKPGAVTVIHPNKDFALGTLKNIYRQAGWKWR